MILFHGGVSGLRPGDALLPADATGVVPLRPSRSDRVYGVTEKSVARGYAALKPDGGLYRVRLLGNVEADPDCLVDGRSFMAPAGVVLEVVDPVVLLRSRSVRSWLRMVNFGQQLERYIRIGSMPVLEQMAGKRFR